MRELMTLCRIIDCHDSLRNLARTFSTSSLREMSKANDEAIYNIDNRKTLNSEIKDYRLPQPLTRLRNDGGANTSDSRHCKDDRTAVHTLHICDSAIASLREMSKANDEAIYNIDNRKTLNGEIKDYRLPQPLTRLRNDAVEDSSESLARTENPSPRNDSPTHRTKVAQ